MIQFENHMHGALSFSEILHTTARSVTSKVAVGTYQKIQGLHKGVKNVTPEDLKTFSKKIDFCAAQIMKEELEKAPLTIVSVGSEGRKEAHPDKYGEEAAMVLGQYGHGKDVVWMVNDPVEGTTPASKNIPGATSVMAFSSEGGLMPTPEKEDYLDKLFAPPTLKNKISIDSPVLETLEIVVREFNLGSRQDLIHVVIMDRPRNAEKIEACKKFGATLHLIQWGDLTPSFLACKEPENIENGVYLLMGIGGFEEGIMGACAAKALGAHAEGKVYHADDKINGVERSVFTVDLLVPGKREDCVVSMSFITDDPWFQAKGVQKKGDKFEVSTLIIAENKFSIESSIY